MPSSPLPLGKDQSDNVALPKLQGWLSQRWSWWAIAAAFLVGAVVAAVVIVPSTLTSARHKARHHHMQRTERGGPDNAADRTRSDAPARTYYIQAELVSWKYLPLQEDLCSSALGNSTITVPEPRWKAVYRQYTDASFQTPVERTQEDEHLGILGPYIRAEAGTSILVVFKNTVPVPLNMEPSGLLFEDAGIVNTGEVALYLWDVPVEAAPPANSTTSSTLWLYRSTVHVIEDVHAGLVGPIIVTRKGEATPDGKPKGVDRELVAVLQIMDEGVGLHSVVSATAPRYKGPGLEAVAPSEEEKYHTINGRMSCNAQGFNATFGEKVRFYVAGLGNEADVHVMHWHGVTLDTAGKRVDQVILVAGATAALDFTADNPGTWLMHCHVNDHLLKGMKAHLHISDGPKPEPTGPIRQYYVAAEVVEWDYAPKGMDLCSGKPQPLSEDAQVFLKPGPNRIGSKYLKAHYVEYTDDTFTTRKGVPDGYTHLGIQGPVLRASVGETIQVLFKNKVPGAHVLSMHPHGVLYAKDSEGARYGDYTSGAMKADDGVPFNQTHMYKWMIPERSGPGPADPSSMVWLYHSHVDEAAETYAGLFGAIVVTRAGEAQDTGRPKGVDAEALMVFMVANEGSSFLFRDNAARYLNITDADTLAELAADEDFQESNLMHSINGYMYCNLPGLELNQGSNARFYVMSYGNEVDMHTPNLFASRFHLGTANEQSLKLLPGSMNQADVQAMVPGTWPIICRVNDHISAGMKALYTIKDEGKLAAAATGVTRTYFIQAEELIWDFTPLGYDGCSGRPFDEGQAVFTVTSENTLGSQYRKALFRGYTDATFMQRAASPAFMGLLGPLIRAEVGDRLELTLRNNATFGVSLQLAGGLWPVNAQSTPMEAVAPGSTKVYSFIVPEGAAPAANSHPPVSAYMYLSGQDLVASSYAGLVGVMLIGAKGVFSGPDGRTTGMEAEIPLLFSVMDENQSPFLDANVALQQTAAAIRAINTTHEDFEESNKMHSINGYSYCNMPPPSIPANSQALVVLMGLGTEVDMHGPVFTGQNLQQDGRPVWAPVLMPAVVEVAVLTTAAEEGSWEFYCMVTDHYAAGMHAKLRITPASGSGRPEGRKMLL